MGWCLFSSKYIYLPAFFIFFFFFLVCSSYVRFDILQRILSRLFGINVIHVMVITDIDDKIIQRSLEVTINTLSFQYIQG